MSAGEAGEYDCVVDEGAGGVVAPAYVCVDVEVTRC